MKSIRLAAFTVLGLGTAVTRVLRGHGRMQNDRHEGMRTQQSQLMTGGQVMSQDVTRDMLGLLPQTRDQTQRIQQLMDHRVGIDVDRQHRTASHSVAHRGDVREPT